ncbi:MAG: PhzF family phenazine biosynthesis protein [Candidatus Competibacter sp.]|nr:PhzF family phenazine biosynthesis protein [Candidatus Competibacter sp.]MDG4582929.1 PhzF family phenazine biosynthesis protein [Candidatus Competibacter sp.]
MNSGRYSFHTLDVFTRRRFGGNPLAVLPDARGLSAKRMQAIAREFNLSETVFVLPPDQPDRHACRLRIFTPLAELPFAGHPTVGAAWLLAAIGRIPLSDGVASVWFEEGVGPVRVRVEAEQGRPAFVRLTAAQAPARGPEPPGPAFLAEILSLAPEEIRQDDWMPESWSCGVPFVCVPLRDREALRRARPRLDRWESVLAGFWAPQVYLFARDRTDPASLHARMFAPALGVAEDPATGAAAVALAGYLASRSEHREGTLGWTVFQGEDMDRPSELRVEAELAAGRVAAAHVGGAAVSVSEGWLVD